MKKLLLILSVLLTMILSVNATLIDSIGETNPVNATDYYLDFNNSNYDFYEEPPFIFYDNPSSFGLRDDYNPNLIMHKPSQYVVPQDRRFGHSNLGVVEATAKQICNVINGNYGTLNSPYNPDLMIDYNYFPHSYYVVAYFGQDTVSPVNLSYVYWYLQTGTNIIDDVTCVNPDAIFSFTSLTSSIETYFGQSFTNDILNTYIINQNYQTNNLFEGIIYENNQSGTKSMIFEINGVQYEIIDLDRFVLENGYTIDTLTNDILNDNVDLLSLLGIYINSPLQSTLFDFTQDNFIMDISTDVNSLCSYKINGGSTIPFSTTGDIQHLTSVNLPNPNSQFQQDLNIELSCNSNGLIMTDNLLVTLDKSFLNISMTSPIDEFNYTFDVENVLFKINTDYFSTCNYDYDGSTYTFDSSNGYNYTELFTMGTPTTSDLQFDIDFNCYSSVINASNTKSITFYRQKEPLNYDILVPQFGQIFNYNTQEIEYNLVTNYVSICEHLTYPPMTNYSIMDNTNSSVHTTLFNVIPMMYDYNVSFSCYSPYKNETKIVNISYYVSSTTPSSGGGGGGGDTQPLTEPVIITTNLSQYNQQPTQTFSIGSFGSQLIGEDINTLSKLFKQDDIKIDLFFYTIVMILSMVLFSRSDVIKVKRKISYGRLISFSLFMVLVIFILITTLLNWVM